MFPYSELTHYQTFHPVIGWRERYFTFEWDYSSGYNVAMLQMAIDLIYPKL